MTRKETLKAFRTDFELATAELAKKYGVRIDLGNITYNETSFRGKLTATNVVEGTKIATEGAGSLLGRFVILRGKTYLVVDYKPSNRKYPVIVEGQRGRRYKISQTQAENGLI